MREVPRFARRFFDPGERLFRIGGGELGGKARGLVAAAEVLAAPDQALAGAGLAVDVPSLAVLGTELFDRFVAANRLEPLLAEGADDRAIAEAFHRGSIPPDLVGDLYALAELVRVPLAVRSSSSLEDALGQPFAGVYGTKMIPMNQPSVEARFQALIDAVKFVWASTWSERARAYRAATERPDAPERMAVLVQEVIGERHGGRFYPDVALVARSWSFYPTGGARPEEGVLDLALGLGKTIVDGGRCWTLSPARPRVPPPFASARERLEGTQAGFWAVCVGAPPPYDPMAETEFLERCSLADAEADGTLARVGSTYDPRSDRIWPGLARSGPRLVDFAPLLGEEGVPLIAAVRALLGACESALGSPVEIEAALALPLARAPRLGFLQVRPLAVSAERVEVAPAALAGPEVVLATERAMGNGRRRLADVIFVDPDRFEPGATPQIAREIEALNRALLAAGGHCLLIGFGRWGSSEPWLGTPVRWDQISTARALVECARPGMSPEFSQGSHFFHNLSSFGVLYLASDEVSGERVDWEFLGAQPEIGRTAHVRHVRCSPPLTVEVDGRSRRGRVVREAA
jgi:hypothetical protein